MALISSPPALEDDIPIRHSDSLVWEVAEARRRAGVSIPKWTIAVGILALIGLFAIGFAALLMAVGVVCLWLSAQTVRRAASSRTWPTVDATITAREIRASQSMTDEDDRTVARQTYTPVARYEYVVDGESYAAISLEDGQSSFSSLGDADQAARRDFPHGVPVLVWYNPANPYDHTRLGPDTGRAIRQALGLGLFGLAFLLAGLVLAVQ